MGTLWPRMATAAAAAGTVCCALLGLAAAAPATAAASPTPVSPALVSAAVPAAGSPIGVWGPARPAGNPGARRKRTAVRGVVRRARRLRRGG